MDQNTTTEEVKTQKLVTELNLRIPGSTQRKGSQPSAHKLFESPVKRGIILNTKHILTMPRRDLYHDIVKNALIREGWSITHDPLILGDIELRVYPDLGAQKNIADRGTHTLAIEIKVFGTIGELSELQKAIGQYVLYRSILRRSQSIRLPYLAIPLHTYQGLFQKKIIQNLIQDEGIHLIVFNSSKEVIEQWID